MGDLLAFAYPEVVKRIFPAKFSNVRCTATVEITLQVQNNNSRVYGKIAALIKDNDGSYFRIGSMLLARAKEVDELTWSISDGKVPLERSVVVVPSGWVLCIDVDLHVKPDNNGQANNLKDTLNFDGSTTTQNDTVGNKNSDMVDVTLTWCELHSADIGKQLSPPVEVLGMESAQPTIVYTIGDELSFSEFIMALRRILADHKQPEDILDGHRLLNLSSTREHPLLHRTSSEQPLRWIHIKLQVEEPNQKTWTTLLMRDDNLYVHGFQNQQGVFELGDQKPDSVHMLPEEYAPKRLELDVSYSSLLQARNGRNEVIGKLRDAKLGRDFAKEAVRVLSGHQDEPNIDLTSVGEKLAGLIVLFCESARMNPLHDYFATGGWSNRKGFTEELMSSYVWNWGNMSECLRNWKKGNYNNLQDAVPKKCELSGTDIVQATYLVLNGKLEHQQAGGPAAKQTSSRGDSSTDQSKKDSREQSRRPGDRTRRPGAGRERDDRMAPRPDPGKSKRRSHPVEADGTLCHGGPRVELFAMAVHPDLLVDGMKIVVFDGKRGQIIYRKESRQQEDEVRQGGQGMVDLVLTGPYRGISAEYGCFAIKIDIPRTTTSTGSSSSSNNKHTPIKWEWDCDDPICAAQVDNLPGAHTISRPDGSEVAKVTYAVMSNAREATVQVKLRLKGGHRPGGISGEITAVINDFKDEDEDEDEKKNNLLRLARNVVAVPCGSALHIEVKLQIETEDGKEPEILNVPLSFKNGIRSRKSKTNDDGNEVEVEVTWYPEITSPEETGEEIDQPDLKLPTEIKPLEETREEIDQPKLKLPAEVKMAPEVVFTIGDEMSFTEFIMALRGILADHPDREDILDHHHGSILSSTRDHPVLAKQRAEQPARWIHVKLQAVKGDETLSTTLLMRDDNMYICGFINQQGVVYELIEHPDRSVNILPVDEYNPRRLSWGIDYRSLLDADTEGDLVTRLGLLLLGSKFAMEAVRVLSGFPSWLDRKMNPRVALARLMFMVCESARMNRVNTFLLHQWYDDEFFKNNELRDYVFNYRRTSHQLLMWKSKGYENPCPMSELLNIYLVLNYRLNPPQPSFMDPGRPRVELLAMHADLVVDGMTVKVFDGKRGHIIYRKEEQEEKQVPEEKGIMVDLVLTGPYTSISAYGCFAIKIDIPPGTAASSSEGDDGGSIKWEWDCYDPKYAEAVMSDAIEATVQVKMRTKDGNNPCSIHGLITARIGDFKDQIILFKSTQATAQHFTPTHSNVLGLARSLKLARNVVAVPCGQRLHIEIHLNIETSKNQGVSNNTHFDDTLSFDNGIWSQHRKVDDVDEIEVNVDWYPDSFIDSSGRSRQMEIEMYPESFSDFSRQSGSIEIEEKGQWQPDISYTIGDDAEGFSTFITELRRLVADHPRCKDLMADHPQLSSAHNHPVLPRARVTTVGNMSRAHMKPEMLFHIKLEAVHGVETSSITLVMRDDNLEIIGFIKKNGECYELRGHEEPELPSEYHARNLPWPQSSILLEESMGLGKTFLEDAVRVVSRITSDAFPDYRKQLEVLMVMIRDSVRMEPVRKAIVGGWNNKDGVGRTPELKGRYRGNWKVISGALLDWRDHAYQGWPQNKELEEIGIRSSTKALEVVPVVFNDKDRILKTTPTGYY